MTTQPALSDCTDITSHPENFIISCGNAVKTTSMMVAKAFGKRHSDVTRKIESLECSSDFRSANFSAHPYTNDQNGEKYTLWEITKDGFMFLVMGFTGKKAALIKEAYIEAFNRMAEQVAVSTPGNALLAAAPQMLSPKVISAINRKAHVLSVASFDAIREQLTGKVRTLLETHGEERALQCLEAFESSDLSAANLDQISRALAIIRAFGMSAEHMAKGALEIADTLEGAGWRVDGDLAGRVSGQ